MARRVAMKNKTLEVVRFEVIRSLKKPSFWIAAILIPVFFGIYIAIAALVGYNTSEAFESGTNTSNLRLGYYDESDYLKSTTFINADKKEQTIEAISSKDAGIEAVKKQEIDVFYYISKDFAETGKVEIYNKPKESSLIDDYSTPIRAVLNATAATNVGKIDYSVIANKVQFNTTTFDITDDHVVDMNEQIRNVIGPGIALACFYILIVVLGNRLTAAMVEEKENRISELILTSIKPSCLIIGKIISLMIVGIIQLVILVVPIIILYKVAQSGNIFPDWLIIEFDIVSLLQYGLLLVASYFLFTAMCIIIGVISPTARDANSYAGAIIILVILPIFFMNVLMSPEMNGLGYFLSYFPPSAPIALMFRGVFHNLSTVEYFIGVAEIAVVGFLTARLATYIYCKNAIEFTPRINFKKLLSSPRKTWKK